MLRTSSSKGRAEVSPDVQEPVELEKNSQTLMAYFFEVGDILHSFHQSESDLLLDNAPSSWSTHNLIGNTHTFLPLDEAILLKW